MDAIIGTALQHLSDCRYKIWRQLLWVSCLSRYPRGPLRPGSSLREHTGERRQHPGVLSVLSQDESVPCCSEELIQ